MVVVVRVNTLLHPHRERAEPVAVVMVEITRQAQREPLTRVVVVVVAVEEITEAQAAPA